MTVAAEAGDRLADPAHGVDDRLPWLAPSQQLLAHPEDEEQPVVGAGPEDQDDQQDLGEERDLERPGAPQGADERARQAEHEGRR